MDYNTLIIRGAEIMRGGFRHFKKDRFGQSFCIDISRGDEVEFGGTKISDPNELIKLLEEDKWDVRYTTPSSDAYDPTPFISVRINFDSKVREPYVYVDDVKYDERMCEALQDARFSNADVAINPGRPTERRDGSLKRTAYLESMHLMLAEDGYRRTDPLAE